MRAHQHRRQPGPELHGGAEQHHANAQPIELRDRLPDVGDHAVEPRRAGVFQPVRREDDEIGLAICRRRRPFAPAKLRQDAVPCAAALNVGMQAACVACRMFTACGSVCLAEPSGNNARPGCRPRAARWSCLAASARQASSNTSPRRRKANAGAIQRLDNCRRCRIPVAARRGRCPTASGSRPFRRRCRPAAPPTQGRRCGTRRGASAPAYLCRNGCSTNRHDRYEIDDRQREQRDLVAGVEHQAAFGEPREGEQRPVPEIQRIGNLPEESCHVERRITASLRASARRCRSR